MGVRSREKEQTELCKRGGWRLSSKLLANIDSELRIIWNLLLSKVSREVTDLK